MYISQRYFRLVPNILLTKSIADSIENFVNDAFVAVALLAICCWLSLCYNQHCFINNKKRRGGGGRFEQKKRTFPFRSLPLF